MNEKFFLANGVTKDEVSNFLLGSAELARLGEFDKAHSRKKRNLDLTEVEWRQVQCRSNGVARWKIR
jgi:hypothetical protein